VRYAQLFNWNSEIEFFANRGTSGIDGSSSTAVGYASSSNKPTLLITGDISFLYDTNAFLNPNLPSNLKVIVVNNNGGGIFRIIEGPNKTSALDQFFETHQNFDIEKISKAYGLSYFSGDDISSSQFALETFFEESKKPSLLELKTPRLENAAVLKNYFKMLSK